MIRPAFLHSSAGQQQQMMQPDFLRGKSQQQEPMSYTSAITQGPNGQMYTDGSMQTPYNPPKNQRYQQEPAPPRMNLVNGDDLRRRQEIQPIQDMRARPPQRGIGSFQNPFGGFMGGGRGNFMQPQPPMYGGGFGMQPPMFGGGMGYGRPPMFGGGMYGGGGIYGGGFGMQPPMFGGGYGGGFGNPFGQSFYGGIGGMFPGMGGGYGQRPPMYGGGFGQQPPSYGGIGGGGGFNRPMPQPMPIQIGRPQPRPIQVGGPVRPPLDSIRPVRPKPINMLERQFPKDSNDSDRFNRFQNARAMPFQQTAF